LYVPCRQLGEEASKKPVLPQPEERRFSVSGVRYAANLRVRKSWVWLTAGIAIAAYEHGPLSQGCQAFRRRARGRLLCNAGVFAVMFVACAARTGAVKGGGGRVEGTRYVTELEAAVRGEERRDFCDRCRTRRLSCVADCSGVSEQLVRVHGNWDKQFQRTGRWLRRNRGSSGTSGSSAAKAQLPSPL
jgi:hypothetical protein